MFLWTCGLKRFIKPAKKPGNQMRFSSLIIVAVIAFCFSVRVDADVEAGKVLVIQTPIALALAPVPNPVDAESEIVPNGVVPDVAPAALNLTAAALNLTDCCGNNTDRGSPDCPDSQTVFSYNERTHPAAAGRRAGEDGEDNNNVVPVDDLAVTVSSTVPEAAAVVPKDDRRGVEIWSSLEHCPDFDERFTLVDGRTKAVSYPRKGYNCQVEGTFLKT